MIAAGLNLYRGFPTTTTYTRTAARSGKATSGHVLQPYFEHSKIYAGGRSADVGLLLPKERKCSDRFETVWPSVEEKPTPENLACRHRPLYKHRTEGKSILMPRWRRRLSDDLRSTHVRFITQNRTIRRTSIWPNVRPAETTTTKLSK